MCVCEWGGGGGVIIFIIIISKPNQEVNFCWNLIWLCFSIVFKDWKQNSLDRNKKNKFGDNVKIMHLFNKFP